MRRARYKMKENDNKMFAGGNLPEVPVRTYGKLSKTESGVTFTYKPWMVLPEKTAVVPEGGLAVGKGLFLSTVQNADENTFFILPPRYSGHEEALVKTYGMTGVNPAGLRKAWSAMRELFGGSAAKTQVV